MIDMPVMETDGRTPADSDLDIQRLPAPKTLRRCMTTRKRRPDHTAESLPNRDLRTLIPWLIRGSAREFGSHILDVAVDVLETVEPASGSGPISAIARYQPGLVSRCSVIRCLRRMWHEKTQISRQIHRGRGGVERRSTTWGFASSAGARLAEFRSAQ
jgi:hypothetical protein